MDPEETSASGHHDERIRTDHVGPSRRNRVHLILSGPPEEDPMRSPGVGITDQFELLAAERMEGMHNAKDSIQPGCGCG